MNKKTSIRYLLLFTFFFTATQNAWGNDLVTFQHYVESLCIAETTEDDLALRIEGYSKGLPMASQSQFQKGVAPNRKLNSPYPRLDHFLKHIIVEDQNLKVVTFLQPETVVHFLFVQYKIVVRYSEENLYEGKIITFRSLIKGADITEPLSRCADNPG